MENVTETMASLALHVNHRIAIHARADPHDSAKGTLLRRRDLYLRIADETVGEARSDRDVALTTGRVNHYGIDIQ